MGRFIGIDLGTTRSVVAVMQGLNSLAVPIIEGGYSFPSVVAFDEQGARLVGESALQQAAANPENTIVSFRRLLGGLFDDLRIVSERDFLPYRIVQGTAGDVQAYIPALDRRFSLMEITTAVLLRLWRAAEAYLGEEVTGAVVTVPASFGYAQRQCIRDAGGLAGLKFAKIITESTAVGPKYALDLPYALHQRLRFQPESLILVLGLGGGTLSVSVLDIRYDTVEVKATSGDLFLGGDDWNRRIARWVLDECSKEERVDLSEDYQARQRLLAAAERAKIELSLTDEVEIDLSCIIPDAPSLKQPQVRFTRTQFEQLTKDLVHRCRTSVERALRDARLAITDIDSVVLAGGGVRMPMIQDLVHGLTGQDPHDWIVSDETVALGAAIYAGVLSGEVADLLLLDAAPLTLSVETLDGTVTPIIKRNSTIPTRGSKFFTSTEDEQPAVDIRIYEGESEAAADNVLLGHLRLDGIPPAPQGVPKIEVTFDIDANNVLTVRAKDVDTGQEQEVTLKEAFALGRQEEFQQFAVTPTSAPSARDRLIAYLAEAKKSTQTDVARPPPPKPLLDLGHRWAVLVGVNSYDDAFYPPLHVCVKDVEAIRKQLIAGGFDPGCIHLLTDNTDPPPTRAKILASLRRAAKAAQFDDLVLFYYSGHGDIVDNTPYLVARDGEAQVLEDTAVALPRVVEILQGSQARAKVVVIDACHSGANFEGKGPKPMPPDFIQRVFEQAKGQIVLASCEQGEFSYEWKAQERSVFTHFLIEALEGKADRDEKGFVTVQDVNRHVSDGVRKWAFEHKRSQTPTFQGAMAGDIILAYCSI